MRLLFGIRRTTGSLKTFGWSSLSGTLKLAREGLAHHSWHRHYVAVCFTGTHPVLYSITLLIHHRPCRCILGRNARLQPTADCSFMKNFDGAITRQFTGTSTTLDWQDRNYQRFSGAFLGSPHDKSLMGDDRAQFQVCSGPLFCNAYSCWIPN